MDFTSLALHVIDKMPVLPKASIDLVKHSYKHPYDFYKEKKGFESSEPLAYDKVRWPMYRELIIKRKN